MYESGVEEENLIASNDAINWNKVLNKIKTNLKAFIIKNCWIIVLIN